MNRDSKVKSDKLLLSNNINMYTYTCISEYVHYAFARLNRL